MNKMIKIKSALELAKSLIDMANEEEWNQIDEAIKLCDQKVMPSKASVDDIALIFEEDTEQYNLWCEIVNEVYMGYDTTDDGSDAENLMNKIEELLKLIKQDVLQKK